MQNFTLVATYSLSTITNNALRLLALSPDGQLLAIGADHGQVYLCHIDALDQPLQLPYADEEYGGVNSVAFNPDSSLLASVTNEGTLNMWDVRHHQASEAWQPPYQDFIGDDVLRKYHHVQSLLFYHDGSLLFGGGSDGVYCWDGTSGRERAFLPAQDVILALALDHSGTWLAGAGWRNHLCLWHLPDGSVQQAVSPRTDRVDTVSFIPNGHIIVSGGGGSEGSIQEDIPSHSLHLWGIQPLQSLRSLATPSRWVASLSWHPRQPILATGASYATITLWDSTTWNIIHVLRSRCHYMKWVCFHPIKPWLLCAGTTADELDYRLEIWEYDT